jgi:hypothetical protein
MTAGTCRTSKFRRVGSRLRSNPETPRPDTIERQQGIAHEVDEHGCVLGRSAAGVDGVDSRLDSAAEFRQHDLQRAVLQLVGTRSYRQIDEAESAAGRANQREVRIGHRPVVDRHAESLAVSAEMPSGTRLLRTLQSKAAMSSQLGWMRGHTAFPQVRRRRCEHQR